MMLVSATHSILEGLPMQKTLCLLALAFVILVPAVAVAQAPDAIVGTWLNAKKTAHIDISKVDGKFQGKIVWLKEPNYPADDKKGMAGQPKVDRENPDPARRKQSLVDLVILRDFTYAKDNLWENGRIYDPENGKSKLRLKAPDTLDVRGFIGFSMLGRTETWTRVK
jgi:uncharacterized protein (DUF2147 family)